MDSVLDQLTDIVNKIISCSDDRRIILSSNSPLLELKMELLSQHMVAQVPNRTCGHAHYYSPSRRHHNKHQNQFTIMFMSVQFHISNGELSCQTYHESADVAVDLPYSIVLGALLTCTIAHLCGTCLVAAVPFIGNPRANFSNRFNYV